MLHKTTKMAAVAMAGVLALGQPLQAQEEVKLRFAHPLSSTHYAWVEGLGRMADAVVEASDGTVSYEVYPAGQLGKDYVSVLNSKLADIVVLIPSYASDKMPLTTVAELPVKYEDACDATRKFWEIARPGGVLSEAEYKPQGMRALFVTILPGYKVPTTTKPVRSLADLQGLKIRASGAAMEQTVRALGAVPIQLTASEINDSLRRGTIDGAIWPYHAAPPYELESLFKYGAEGPNLGSATIVFAMAESKWQSLPENIRQEITAAAAEAQENLCRWTEGEEARVRQDMIDKYGYQPTVLSDEEIALWNEKTATVAEGWAARMNDNRKPGTEILEAFRQAE